MAAHILRIGAGAATARVEVSADGALIVDGAAIGVTHVGGPEWRLVVAGRATRVFVAGPPTSPWVWCDGRAFRLEVADAARPPSSAADIPGGLSAPMPATVREIRVAPGDVVARGDTLLVLEAMKMELPLRSPADGTVASVACQVGEMVQPGVPLVELA